MYSKTRGSDYCMINQKGMKDMYDYLIVGAGLYGAVFARELCKQGKSCLVIDRRNHIAGNIYTENVSGINVHKYGAHIFHTSDKEVWDYVNQFAEFNHYINAPIAVYKDELYNLPFNMNTFSRMWGIRTPAEAKAKIAEQVAELAEALPVAVATYSTVAREAVYLAYSAMRRRLHRMQWVLELVS